MSREFILSRREPALEKLDARPVGHPAESKPPGDRFNVHRIHRNRW